MTKLKKIRNIKSDITYTRITEKSKCIYVAVIIVSDIIITANQKHP